MKVFATIAIYLKSIDYFHYTATFKGGGNTLI